MMKCRSTVGSGDDGDGSAEPSVLIADPKNLDKQYCSSFSAQNFGRQKHGVGWFLAARGFFSLRGFRNL
jgi:hypothetical protein